MEDKLREINANREDRERSPFFARRLCRLWQERRIGKSPPLEGREGGGGAGKSDRPVREETEDRRFVGHGRKRNEGI